MECSDIIHKVLFLFLNQRSLRSLFTLIVLVQFLSVIHAAPPSRRLSRSAKQSQQITEEPERQIEVRLYIASTRKFLGIYGQKKGVLGNLSSSDPNANIVVEFFKSNSDPPETYVRLKGDATRGVVCFNRRGKAIVRYPDPFRNVQERCLFKVVYQGIFIQLQSVADSMWHLVFKKNGKPGKGYDSAKCGTRNNTQVGQRCLFSPITEKEPPTGLTLPFRKIHNILAKSGIISPEKNKDLQKQLNIKIRHWRKYLDGRGHKGRHKREASPIHHGNQR